MVMLEEIVALLDQPASGKGAPTLVEVEDTLTAGYAQALALDAERLRFERRLGALARTAGEGDDVTDGLSELSDRLAATERDLTRLRAVLAILQDRARELRAANR